MPVKDNILWRAFKVILSKWIDDIDGIIACKDIDDLHSIRNEMMKLRGDIS